MNQNLGDKFRKAGESVGRGLGEEMSAKLEDMASNETNVMERVILAHRIKSWCKAIKR